MLVQTKRRRISILSLPIVVAIGFLVVAKLAAWQRSDLIAELADCVAHGETHEAIDAVHKLAAMPDPPVSILVAAAASDEHETAEAGQVAISRLLRRWQRDIETNRRAGSVASQLSELAKMLAEQREEFATADHAWLAITARKIMRLANKYPPPKTPMVAVHCDAILTAVGGSATTPSAVPVAGEFGLAPKNEASRLRLRTITSRGVRVWSESFPHSGRRPRKTGTRQANQRTRNGPRRQARHPILRHRPRPNHFWIPTTTQPVQKKQNCRPMAPIVAAVVGRMMKHHIMCHRGMSLLAARIGRSRSFGFCR